MCVCVCLNARSVGKGRHIWLFHTYEFSSKLCRANKHTNQFNFRWLNFSLDKRIHNSIQYILRLVYHRAHTVVLFFSVFLSHSLTYMIYAIFNFEIDATTPHFVCVRFILFFFFSFFFIVVVVGSSIWLVFGLVRKQLADKRTSRGALQINSMVNQKLCKTHLSCAIFVQSLLLDMHHHRFCPWKPFTFDFLFFYVILIQLIVWWQSHPFF